jgi:hypothetical protein
MNRNNLRLICQPAWKVMAIDFVARCLGLLVHVEGIPVGNSRDYLRRCGPTETEAKTWGV